MTILSGINRLIGLFVSSLRMIFHGKIWLLLFLYTMINALVLYAHYDYTSPMFSPLIGLWARLFDSELTSYLGRYPGHFIVLPTMFGWAKFVVGFALEGLIMGLVARRFLIAYTRRDSQESSQFKPISAVLVQLVLGWLIINSLMVAVGVWLPDLVYPLIAYSPRRMALFSYLGLPILYVIITAIFLFLYPLISIYGLNVLAGIRNGLRLFKENFFTCIFLAALLTSGSILVSFVTGNPALIVEKFRPELVFWALMAGLLVEMVANFFWMSTTVRFLLDEER